MTNAKIVLCVDSTIFEFILWFYDVCDVLTYLYFVLESSLVLCALTVTMRLVLCLLEEVMAACSQYNVQ